MMLACQDNLLACATAPLLRGARGCVLNRLFKMKKITFKRRIIPYNKHLKEYARQHRNNSTLGEILLWKQLRNYQIYGYDFHRQKPLLNY